MKTIYGIVISVICFISTEVLSAGMHEIGVLTIEGKTCRWTSPIKRNCTKEAMQKKSNEFMNCFDGKTQKEAEKCQDAKCVSSVIARNVTYCCKKTQGSIKE